MRRPGAALSILISLAGLAGLPSLAGCVELGVISDGSSASIGRPSGGYLLDGKRLPDHGEGFTTCDTWRERGNRYGTDELLDLITATGRRLAMHFRDVRLVVADLSVDRGGAARPWHRSHQSGRDVDLVYYMRDAAGQPMQADAMRAFNAQGLATDGSGISIDIPRTWLLVKELVTAPEAVVQYVFIYEPIAVKLLEHAVARGEPERLIARARMVLRQPGDSAPHHDHLHVRVYCSERDRAYGCVDIGRMEVLALHEAERRHAAATVALVAALLDRVAHAGAQALVADQASPVPRTVWGAPPAIASVAASVTSSVTSSVTAVGMPTESATATASTTASATIATPVREVSSLSGAIYLRRWMLGR